MAEENKMEMDDVLKSLYEKESEAKGKYLEDVKFLYESVQKGTYSKRDFLCGVLCEYIEGGSDASLGKNVALEGKDEEAVYVLLNQILSLENAPLGKWPGKEELKLWQQVDVNLAIQKGKDEAFEEAGKVIAASEKTDAEKEAVLKELLANAVVEKASLLANYDKPDDAFESFAFYHGEEKNHAYAEFPAKWHRIREDRLNDYGMLMTAATDAPIRKLCKDLEAQEKTMGLLAASISDNAQKKEFYDKVLAPMIKSFREDEVGKERLPKYSKAREEFLAQKKIVTDMQVNLDKLSKELFKNWQEEKLRTKSLRAAEAEIEHAKKDAEYAEASREPLRDQRDKAVSDMNEFMDKLDEMGAAAQAAKIEWTRLNDIIRTGFDKEQELRGSVNAMTKLLSKKKYDSVMEEADKYQKEAIEAQEKAPAAEKKMKELAMEYDKFAMKRDKLQKDQEAASEKLASVTKVVNGARQVIAKKEEEADQLRHALESVKKEKETILEIYSKESGEDQRVLLDMDFVKDLLSKDAKVREKKEAENPWMSQKYQKEREKLFTLALALQKAFVEASECCMANLATLSQYWGFWKKGNEKITFHQADLDDTTPSLWQTLFLMVPVVELELSGVAETLRDAKKAGLTGMMVVDCDGKLAPVKVLGATYRCRRAVSFK
ncbi:MAG: hypothetical protein J6Z22_03295 [Lachnospiraceae bacterium]|nr:hypothetical protein [Lachnospiraceae bacterium]